ncbi:hypothetical protein V0288_19770 [Pannus brasiliensis CCIBt3594]|uniref:Uncharacterized protein n=1 Tax=Pannus brasiliensis CCIBt3594 TaxID=1427578 RepID=A0AAW9QVJ9_9CHRO
MQYSFERLRFHFIEHAVGQVWQEGNATATVIDNLQKELDRGLTEEETDYLRERVRLLCAETDKLIRSRIPHDLPSRHGDIELWGYQQIRTLDPDTYIHHEQPGRADFDNGFALPEGEVWAWNVLYTFTGPYYGIQSDENGQSATRSSDLGSRDLVLQSAAALATFPDCEVLGDLTPDNLDLFTLEADECAAIGRSLQQRQREAIETLSPLAGGDERAATLVNAWQIPLKSAERAGIGQFKRVHSDRV